MLIWTPVTEFISDINLHEFHTEEEKNIRTGIPHFESNLHVDSPKINFLSFKIDDRIDSHYDPYSRLSEKYPKNNWNIFQYDPISSTISNYIIIKKTKNSKKNASFIIDKIELHGIPRPRTRRGWMTINERLLKQPLIAVIAWNKSR